jgi:hypothetical protein
MEEGLFSEGVGLSMKEVNVRGTCPWRAAD